MKLANASQDETELDSLVSPLTPAPDRRRSHKRQAIIAAAKEMFFQEGYAGASMDRITAKAGVSKATIYSHFRSKEELLMAVVEDVVSPIQTGFLSALDPSASLSAWLLSLGELLAREVLLPDVTALERLVIAEALRFPELGRIFRSVAVVSSLEVLKPRLERAMAEGELRRADPMVALQHFMQLCVGSFRQQRLLNEGEPPGEAEVQRHVADVVGVFLHGYAGRETP